MPPLPSTLEAAHQRIKQLEAKLEEAQAQLAAVATPGINATGDDGQEDEDTPLEKLLVSAAAGKLCHRPGARGRLGWNY